jgi:two-component system response regulator VanR
MEHAWDVNADPFSNTLETHIRTLRKKIDTPGETKLIHTVPGKGYRMYVADGDVK